MKGTRVKIIKDLIAQLTSTPNSTRLVMLSGVAGSGKSTIAKTVATILAEEKNILAASFFFSRDHADRKEINYLATTLAMQLAEYDPDFQTHLLKLLESDSTGICEAAPRLQFQKLVVEILGKLPPSSKPWIICLDALDECGEDHGQIFLRWLSDNIAQIPAHIRFFLTGRPEVPSYLKFDELRSLMHRVVLDEVEPILVQDDIYLYVEQSLDGANWITRHPWKIQSQQAIEITTQADGLFVFAATVVRYVLAGLPQTHPQESVDDLLLDGEPLTDLHDLYLRIMNYAIPFATRRDRRSQRSHDRTMKILSTILQLLEPLDSQSLADLLEVDKTVLLNILLPLSAVIHVSDTPGAGIRIIHLSFREFMTSYVQETRPEILCGTDDQQRALVSALVKVLDKHLKFNICDLPTSYLRNTDMPKFQQRLDIYIPLHLRYAAQFWIDHVVETAYNLWSGQMVQNLLFKKFLFWLELLSLLENVHCGYVALSRLMVWTNESTPVLKFVTDAKRFITFFWEAINQSAPHIYLSALALAPEKSEITKRFSHEFPQLLTVTKGRMKQWPSTIVVLEGPSGFSSVVFSPDGKRIVSGSYDKTVRIWDAETGAKLRDLLGGHTDLVTSVAFSPDSKRIVFGSSDKTVRIWDAETGAELRNPLEGHTDVVTSVAFSPDGKRIVSGSDDKTVRIWDAETGAELRDPLGGHTDLVTSVAFSPDGKRIVSGSYDKTVRIWDAETGAKLRDPLEEHTDLVTSVAFSPDGKRIVSGSSDKTVRIWDAETGAELRNPLEGHTDVVTSVAFSPDGKRIVSGSSDKTVRIWDAETGAELRNPLEGHTDVVTSVAFSPDGKRIVSGSSDKTVRIWDAETGAELRDPLEGHTYLVTSVAFSPDGKRIVSGSYDKTVRIWDAETGAELRDPLEGHTNSVTSVAFSPDGKRIVSGSYDKTVRIWDAETGAELRDPLGGHTDLVTSVAFSPDSKRIVSGSYDKTVRIWDAETGAKLRDPLGGHTDWVTSVAFSPDGKRIVSGSYDKTVRIWDAETGAELRDPLEGHTYLVTSVAFSPDGKRIVSGSDDKTVRIWDAETGAELRDPLEGHTYSVTSVAFSSDGKRIMSGSDDTTVRIWDAETGAELRDPLEEHTDWVTSVAFSPDGKRIVSGSDDKTVRIWDAETGAELRDPLEGHTYLVTSVAFSPDGKRIVSGSSDKTVRIWDAETGAELRDPLEGHTDWVTSVAFSPDGKRIVSGSDDKTVRIWDAETGAELRDPLGGHTDLVTSVAFSPDGKRIVSGSYDNTVRIWAAELGSTNCTMCPRNFDGPVIGSYLQHASSASEWSLCHPLQLKSPSSSAPLHWHIHNGWVSCLNSELLFWVPAHHRAGLWSPLNTLVIGQEQTLLSYDLFVYGTDWAKCYAPAESL
ncbi:WD40-repeat-containing domain protein [Mycena haematopus]|nr:WD40-repeat-containing domain protein [Mycena haematopus]